MSRILDSPYENGVITNAEWSRMDLMWKWQIGLEGS